MIASTLLSFSQVDLQRLMAARANSPGATAGLRRIALAMALTAMAAGVATGLLGA